MAKDPFKEAEAVFKPKPPVLAEGPAKAPALPGAKATVTLRLDQDVVDHFQNEGPGWRDRINAALRKAAGI